MTRRSVLTGLLASSGTGALADAPLTSLFPMPRGGNLRVVPPDVSALIADANLTGVVTYVVADALSGEVIEADGGDVPMPPASVTKMITSLYALETLGPSHRFATRVLATGPVRDGIVQGDLILAGGGDPTLDTDRLAALVERLAQAGIKGVAGAFGVYVNALPPIARIDPTQPDHVGYNPTISGLNLNFNRVHFSWQRNGSDYAFVMDARSAQIVPPVAMATMVAVDRAKPLFIYEEGMHRDNWSVARGALGREGSRWLPVRQPLYHAGDVFNWLAAAQGIELPPLVEVGVLPESTVLAEDRSDALIKVLTDMMLYSTNLTAEVVGLTTSGRATLAHSASAMTYWAKVALGMTSNFADHSGLGLASRTTATDMVRVLVAAQRLNHGTLLREILRDLGMRDEVGDVIDGHAVRVRAKSGTLNFVSGLAGFITPPSKRELAFAMFIADEPRRAALDPEQREDPEGGEAWTRRARNLQGRLISRWAALYA